MCLVLQYGLVLFKVSLDLLWWYFKIFFIFQIKKNVILGEKFLEINIGYLFYFLEIWLVSLYCYIVDRNLQFIFFRKVIFDIRLVY